MLAADPAQPGRAIIPVGERRFPPASNRCAACSATFDLRPPGTPAVCIVCGFASNVAYSAAEEPWQYGSGGTPRDSASGFGTRAVGKVKPSYVIDNLEFAPHRCYVLAQEGKPLFFSDLDNEARQRLINVQQRADALRAAEVELKRRFSGAMMWKKRAGKDYLYRRIGQVDTSLGPRSEPTEATYRAFTQGKALVEQRLSGLRKGLEDMARVNRAMGLGRVPRLVGRILRRLDQVGVLGEQVCVVGTNALFAYEASAGIRFEQGLLATDDVDLALDARRNLNLAGKTMPDGLLGLLRKIDATFAPFGDGHFTAVNKSGLMVDLITPEPRNPMSVAPTSRRRLGGTSKNTNAEDVQAVEIPRLELIVDAPRFSSTAISDEGLPVWIAATDPRWWAAHKLWLASQDSRDPRKRQRDHDQAYAVAAMLATRWQSLDLSDSVLAAAPATMRQSLREAVAATSDEQTEYAW